MIHYSIIKNRIDLLQFFLSSGFDIEIPVNNWTPLILAVQLSNLTAVEMLLFYKAQVDVTNAYSIFYFFFHQTPLIIAIMNNDVDIVLSLLRAGASINESPYSLHCAVQQGNLEIIKLLMMFGADPNLKTPSGKTAFDLLKSEQDTIKSALTEIQKAKIPHPLAPKINMIRPPVSSFNALLDIFPPTSQKRPQQPSISQI